MDKKRLSFWPHFIKSKTVCFIFLFFLIITVNGIHSFDYRDDLFSDTFGVHVIYHGTSCGIFQFILLYDSHFLYFHHSFVDLFLCGYWDDDYIFSLHFIMEKGCIIFYFMYFNCGCHFGRILQNQRQCVSFFYCWNHLASMTFYHGTSFLYFHHHSLTVFLCGYWDDDYIFRSILLWKKAVLYFLFIYVF